MGVTQSMVFMVSEGTGVWKGVMRLGQWSPMVGVCHVSPTVSDHEQRVEGVMVPWSAGECRAIRAHGGLPQT